MKRFLIFLLAVAVLLPGTAYAGGFSEHPRAVEAAAKSVLMLDVYDAEGYPFAAGSGFIAFDDRTLVTNLHVTEGAGRLAARSEDGEEYEVTGVLVADTEKDILICTFDSPTGLRPLELNAEGELLRAERVVAIGNPLGTVIGLTNTVSLGNISALYNDGIRRLVQFTAPISPGSSGGALFDDEGRVIGITTGSYNEGGAQNINFAVHASEIRALYEQWDGTVQPLGDYLAGKSADPETDPEHTFIPEPTPGEDPLAGETYPELKRGDKGDAVTELQLRLIDLGYLEGPADGVFGRNTEAAVELFNRCNGNSGAGKTADSRMQTILYSGNGIRLQ